ncbi:MULTISPECIES: NACHT N-terminal Helical domain 1-containing protein [unclassified Modestobacter]|uniref:NACHT N-terminal Helical domain 1-containing protein n=1 Tax=unclassified Modestobacter TaxID=2643866 RepID=UPI0022AA6D2B|nr:MULTISPECIES: SEFIR domain-containing protein [unclassified Modestobacter]MCZ2826050.1 TIR domain-containing protein [Modestobacter sp. VKM Ac-2981]MCZ2852885.1 TIR domain-containing protein [Modestobacter sp. VKM Ac-2982]
MDGEIAAGAAQRGGAPIRVFISYAHESAEHEDLVRRFAIFLRHNGVDAKIDVPAAEERQDWPAWMSRQVRAADWVLVIASPSSAGKAPSSAGKAESRPSARVGLGSRWESTFLRETLYQDDAPALQRVVPVVLPGGHPEDLPSWVHPTSTTVYAISDFTVAGAEKLLRLLTHQTSEVVPELGSAPMLAARAAPNVQLAAARGVVQHALANWMTDRSLASTRREQLSELLRKPVGDRSTRTDLDGRIDALVRSVDAELEWLVRLEFSRLAPNERSAALALVVDILGRADLSAEELFAVDFDSSRLANRLRTDSAALIRSASLSEAASVLFDRVLERSCELYVRVLRQMPAFGARGQEETLSRLSELAERASQSLPLSAGSQRDQPEYWATVREVQVRTPRLIERQAELAEIAEFATGPPGYRWLVGGPWAGKTALLAEAVVAALPAEVDVVVYFASRREADADAHRFLAAVVPQLEQLLDEEPAAPDVHRMRRLWERAVQRAASVDRDLLLVVDGLDEDLQPPSVPSIASLLPARLGARGHVLVASRLHPSLPADVDLAHPLRATTPVVLRPWGEAEHLATLSQAELETLGSLEQEFDVLLRGERAGHSEAEVTRGLLELQRERLRLEQSRRGLTAAAAAGHLNAQVGLGLLLATQWDPPQLAEARWWLEAAARAGNTEAQVGLEQLSRRMENRPAADPDPGNPGRLPPDQDPEAVPAGGVPPGGLSPPPVPPGHSPLSLDEQPQDRRVFSAELEDHTPDAPLQVGAGYTLAFGIYPKPRAQAIAQALVLDSLLHSPDSDESVTELTVQVDTDDFRVFDRSRPLFVPRSGRSLNKARFDFVPLRNGPATLTAIVHREGNFIHQLRIVLPVGAPGAIEVKSTGRSLGAAEKLTRRDLMLVLEPGVNGTYECRVIGPVAGHATLPVTREQLADAIESARAAIGQVVEQTEGDTYPFSDGLDIPKVAERSALQVLARAGARLFQKIFSAPRGGEDARVIGEGLQRMATDGRHQLQIQVVSHDFPVPWPLLYLGDVRPGADLSWDLFLGMRHVIECIPSRHGFPALDVEIASHPQLSVGVNLNTAIDKELNGDYVACQQTWWSETALSRPRVHVIPRSLRDEVLTALADNECADQIFYLYCHARAKGRGDPGGIDASALELTDGFLTLEQLNLDAPTNARLPGNPLIFLNACESAELSPLFYDGFVPYFMSKGARGVIGTECRIPARFATEWAQQFFDRFLDGVPLGEAVLGLRRSFLEEHRNPLGLIYAVHCDSDTVIAPALPRHAGHSQEWT